MHTYVLDNLLYFFYSRNSYIFPYCLVVRISVSHILLGSLVCMISYIFVTYFLVVRISGRLVYISFIFISNINKQKILHISKHCKFKQFLYYNTIQCKTMPTFRMCFNDN